MIRDGNIVAVGVCTGLWKKETAETVYDSAKWAIMRKELGDKQASKDNIDWPLLYKSVDYFDRLDEYRV